MSKWYSFEELKRARTPMPLDSVTGLPDNHVITVVERVISVDDPELIQNNVRTDTFTLNLDAEYDDLNVVVIFTKPNNINVKVAYNGTPTHIPGSAMELVGSLACSVVGIDADGEVRAVTKAAPDTFQVVKSGAYDGSVTSDDAELLGQILQAVSDAETAITAAETATTAATNATSQATSAATSANKAASSANSAASSANSAATRATSAAVNAENAYDTLQPYMATIDSCANILHREVGPDTVVTADDSFPCKPVEMVVYGNTVQNLWVNPSGTSISSNPDGSLRISVTGGKNETARVSSYALKPSTQYTASVNKSLGSPTSYALNVRFVDSGGQVIGNMYFGQDGSYATERTFTSPASFAYAVFEVVTADLSGTYRVMLNEGSEAQPWCPPGLNSVGQLRDDEKNLWVNPQGSANGITVTNNDDGSVTLEGTATASGSIATVNTTLKPNKKYTWTIDHTMAADVYFVIFYGSVYQDVGRDKRSGTFSTGSDVSNARFAIYMSAGGTISGTYKVMLNEGSTAKPWVPPESESCVQVVTAGKNLLKQNLNPIALTVNGIKFTPNEDGSVKVSGTSTGIADFYLVGKTWYEPETNPLRELQEEMVLSGGSKDCEIVLYGVGDDGNHVSIGAAGSTAKVIPGNSEGLNLGNWLCYLSIAANKTIDAVIYPQLELGSTATAYEPPNITTTTPIDLQGHTLNALPDGTRDELHIDGGGNVVLKKRVYRAHADADGFAAESTEYSEMSFGTGCDYANGVMFARQSQRNDFAPVANADILSNGPRAAVYTLDGRTRFRVGDGTEHNSAQEQLESVKSKVGSKGVDVMWALANHQTIDLGTITPPTMAAPNVTAYIADDTPAEMELDYVRDINIVVDRLEKKVADLVVTEATIV